MHCPLFTRNNVWSEGTFYVSEYCLIVKHCWHVCSTAVSCDLTCITAVCCDLTCSRGEVTGCSCSPDTGEHSALKLRPGPEVEEGDTGRGEARELWASIMSPYCFSLLTLISDFKTIVFYIRLSLLCALKTPLTSVTFSLVIRQARFCATIVSSHVWAGNIKHPSLNCFRDMTISWAYWQARMWRFSWQLSFLLLTMKSLVICWRYAVSLTACILCILCTLSA